MLHLVFAEFISFLFHPVLFFFFMPFLVVYRGTSSGLYALKWQLFSSFFLALGVIVYLIGRWKGIFTDIDLSKKEERMKYYAIVWPLAFLYLAAALFFKGIFFPMSIVAIGIVLGILLFAAVNAYTKASIHTAVACAYVITTGLLYGATAFYLTVWIIPLVIWSRLVLKRHTLVEVATGAFLGSMITLLTFYIGKEFLTHV